jgi:hypothetical protein
VTATDAEIIANQVACIHENWPRIEPYIPANAIPRLDPGAFHLRTHSKDVLAWWLTSRGGKHFIMTASPPPAFFWLALPGSLHSEHLFVMWDRDGRKFWFHSAYYRTYGSEKSIETSVRQLDAALERWRTTSGDIAYSGDWGWCDPTTGRFDKDFGSAKLKEEWER